MATFKGLSLRGWRQFEDVDLDLSKQVTVLTGQNGCGKTTILNTLNHHFGWNIHFVSTPWLGKRKAKKLWSDVYGHLTPPNGMDHDELSDDLDEDISEADDSNSDSNIVSEQIDWLEDATDEPKEVGSIVYDNDQVCTLTTRTLVSAQYQLQYAAEQAVVGLHIPSHRPVSVYHDVQNIPTNPKDVAQVYQDYQQLLFQSFSAGNRQNPGMIRKQSLISMMVFGEGNSSVQANHEYVDIIDGFQIVLRQLLPPDLGFRKLEVRMPDVVLVTDTGTFALDAMSGGVGSLFDLAWQIHMYGYGKDSCTVTMDEPENHLHPSMQRSLLPSLAKAFPDYCFIIATHSPFIVTSFPNANVYGLIYSKNHRPDMNQMTVISRLLGEKSLAGTPNSVLREILDVDSNLPLWVESELRNVLANPDYNDQEKARLILDRLEELGITDALPTFLDS